MVAIDQDHPYDENLLKFYAGVYGREHEISHRTNPTRHLTYEYYPGNGKKILFTGCEVVRIESIPDKMAVWEIGPERLCIRDSTDANALRFDGPITWNWRHGLDAFGTTFIAGDFVVSKLPVGMPGVNNGPFTFCFSENTYIDYDNGNYKEDAIFLSVTEIAIAQNPETYR